MMLKTIRRSEMIGPQPIYGEELQFKTKNVLIFVCLISQYYEHETLKGGGGAIRKGGLNSRQYGTKL